MTDFTQNTGAGGQLKLSLTEISTNAGANTSVVHVKYQIFTPSGSGHLDNNISVSLSGDVAFSGLWSFTTSGGWHVIHEADYTIAHNADGTKTMSVAASMGATGTSGVGGPTTLGPVSYGLTTLQQTVAPPTAVLATRVGDTQMTVGWTNNSTPSATYANCKIYRTATDDSGWANIATLGVVTTYSDTGVTANHRYKFAVNAVGVNGVEVGSVELGRSDWVWTTPGAPTACTATKQPNGDVAVGWANNVNYSEYTTRVEESVDGGAFAEIGSVAADVTAFTHVAPSGGATHTYRVRARTTTGTVLDSAYSPNSNTVTLIATANPPTGLTPSGVPRDAAGAIVLSWTHNPADGTPQSKYQLQWSTNGGSSWTTVGPTTTGTSSHTLAGGTVANGQTVTWRVATAGQNGTLSAYSANASFTTSATPTVTISTPGASHGSSHLTAAWVYFQPASAQATWQATLLDASGATIETRSGTTETTAVFAATLADATTYRLQVSVTSAAGLASLLAERTFAVAYLPPAAITIAGAFDGDSGFTVLTLTGDGDVPGVTEPITTVDVHRQIDGGAWVTILTGIVLDAASLTAIVQDTVPITVGVNTYRAIAYSALPSSVMSAAVEVTTAETTWGYLSGGGRFATVARFRALPTYAASSSRAKALYHFAGRPKPVQLTGEAVTDTLGVSGSLSSGSGTVADFRSLGRAEGVVCWRGPDGERVFGSVDKVSTGTTRLKGLATVAFTLTELDFTEGDQ